MEDSTNTPNTVVDGPEASAENPFDKKKEKGHQKYGMNSRRLHCQMGVKKLNAFIASLSLFLIRADRQHNTTGICKVV